MYVVPVNGRNVPDPEQADNLPLNGREVPINQYWLRRIADGDVTLASEAPAVGLPVWLSELSAQLATLGVPLGRPTASPAAVGADAMFKRSRVGTRIWSLSAGNSKASDISYGWSPTNQPTTMTSWLLTETEAPAFDAISVIFANATDAPITVAALSIAAASRAANFNTNLSGSVVATFGGSPSGSIPVAALGYPGILISDPYPVSSVARTDGGKRPLVAISAQFPVAPDGSTVLSYWSRTGPAWGSTPTGGNARGRVLMTLNQPGAVALASSYAAGGSQTGNSCIFGFAYWSRGKVMTIQATGDSISAGTSLQNRCYSWLIKACEAASTPEMPVEYMVCGLPGVQPAQYASLSSRLHALSGFRGGVGLPTAEIYAAFSPNFGNVIGTREMNLFTQPMTQLFAENEQRGIVSAVWTGLPRMADGVTRTSSGWSISSDNNRKAFNAAALNFAVPRLDFCTAVSDAGSPQLFQFASNGYPVDVTSDGLHLNDAGDTRIGVGDAYLPGGVVLPFVRSMQRAYFS